jgi:polyhydroxyalkanoate synthase subunit PhaC
MQPSYHWFQQLDQLRKAQGRVMDLLGLGPEESPFHIVLEQPGLRLRLYGHQATKRPPLLIVPAPIKKSYIWDLSAESSVVRRALRHLLDVYMVEWTEPEPGPHAPGLFDYAGTMLDDCISAIRVRSGSDKVFLAGHSLGGIFAALHSAYKPAQVAGLVLVDAPLHFAEGAGSRKGDVPGPGPRVPGSLVGLASALAKPAALCTDRYLDRMASLRSREQTLSHWRVERWTLDELPMSRNLFDDVINDLHKHNRFMRGELVFGEERLHPRKVTAPLFNIFHPLGGIVPAESVLAFHGAAGSEHKELVRYAGDVGVALQHVGPLVGINAHRDIWPRVFAWLDRI